MAGNLLDSATWATLSWPLTGRSAWRWGTPRWTIWMRRA